MLKMICCIAADILALIYLIWPFDIVPDIMPVVGFMDDLIAILAAVAFTIKMIRDRFKDSVNRGKKNNG
ncbi:YkvA family protein [Treponema sp.]|uniref:YkvA family protein n=1 Tax=Treponema sp. TaxID=166 RepID=UPI003FA26F40